MIKALTERNGSALAEVMGRHMDQALLRIKDAL
jgi:DNA-binding GntR family transcriptional regulator